MDLSFLSAYALVLLAIAISYRMNLHVEKTLFYSSIRAFFQLITLGIALSFIIDSQESWLIPVILAGMVTFAANVAKGRCEINEKSYVIPFMTIGGTALIILTPLVLFGIISATPRELIPIGGMVIGNTLNAYTLSVERFKKDTAQTLDQIEARLSLGESYDGALIHARRGAIKAAMIPVLNTLKTVGAVFIPGIMTGMILAGEDPLKAASYQMVIVYMLAAAATLSAMFGTYLASQHILRLPSVGK